MTVAMGASGFDSDHPKTGISQVADRPGYRLIKSRPSASAIKFMGICEEQTIACLAMVISFFKMLVVRTGEGSFGTPLSHDMKGFVS